MANYNASLTNSVPQEKRLLRQLQAINSVRGTELINSGDTGHHFRFPDQREQLALVNRLQALPMRLLIPF